jgi:putative transposase
MERYQQTLKVETLRPRSPGSSEEARQVVARSVEHYNHVWLHSAIGYITPADALAERGPAIWAGCDEKLEAVRVRRRQLWEEQLAIAVH